MKGRKRLAQSNDLDIICRGPFPDEVVAERDKEYPLLSEDTFQKKYRHYAFIPAEIQIGDKVHEIQLNFCNDTFCDNYGLSQYKYNSIKGKPLRYQLSTMRTGNTGAFCNRHYDTASARYPLIHNTQTISNWSVAEEIKRLITINSVVPMTKEYKFHKFNCKNDGTSPADNPEVFYRFGKSLGKCTRYQCKECKKTTNVLPDLDERFNFRQKRNDVLVELSRLLFSRTPVTRICKTLDMGAGTFYNKVDWLYRKCLEFNAKFETGPLSSKSFNTLWINTDTLVYNLNNIRLRGKKDGDPYIRPDKLPATNVICSTDMMTSYIFRIDVAYDSDVTLGQVEEDTKQYHCDHSYPFLRKNDRLQYSVCPQPPIVLPLSRTRNYSSKYSFRS